MSVSASAPSGGAAAVATPRKKKRVSKKTKASWRKHVDIADIEDFLENKRQDERIGKIADKPDDKLFHVDINTNVSPQLSEREKRKTNARREATNLVSLRNISQVSDPIVKRNHVKPMQNRRGPINENTYTGKPQPQKTVAKKVPTKDVWQIEDVGETLREFKNDMISKDLALHHLKNTGRILVKVPESTHHKTSMIKAFVAPHPGTSYNPSLNDHQKLLASVVQKEEELMKKEEHLDRVTTHMFSKITEFEREYQKLKELSAGVPTVEDAKKAVKVVEDDIPFENYAAYIPVNPPVLNKKKTRQTIRKQIEQREINRALKEKKLVKQQVTDIHRLRQLKENVLVEETATKNLMRRRKIIAKKKNFLPRQLSKVKFVEADIDVNQASDIAGNIRNIKPETNLLVDRFKDMQKRNILLPKGTEGMGKKRKIKRFVRSSHREEPKQLPAKRKQQQPMTPKTTSTTPRPQPSQKSQK